MKAGNEYPKVVEELATGFLDNGKETRKNRRGKDNSEQVRLDHIRNKELGSLLVKSKLLFQHKGVVDACGQRDNLVDEDEAEDEHYRLRNFTSEAGRGEPEKEIARPGPEFRENIKVVESEVLELTIEIVDESELGLGAAVCLRFVEDFLRYFMLQYCGRFGFLQNTILADAEQGLEDELGDGEADNQLLPWE